MNIIESNVNIRPTTHSRLHEVDMDNIPFGRVFSDHMVLAHFRDGKWSAPEIVPYQRLEMAPSTSALNYGQSIFEGMKAFKNPLGEPLLFRPEDNFNRMNRSAIRMCMPELPKHIFMDGLKELIRLDQQWIPPTEKGALYIRPLMFATDEFIGVKASQNYTFVIFTSPVGPYYTEPVNLLATKDYVRAAIGGTGSAKAAGNYAGALYPDKLAKEQGYHNVLWLDAREHQYIEECGTMNVFFVVEGKVITPHLSGTILPGFTRDSAIRLLSDEGYRVDVRRVSIYELVEAYNQGVFQEAFGTGTAATIAHIAKLGFGGEDMILPPMEDRKIGNWLNERLEGIRTGTGEDPYRWSYKL